MKLNEPSWSYFERNLSFVGTGHFESNLRRLVPSKYDTEFRAGGRGIPPGPPLRTPLLPHSITLLVHSPALSKRKSCLINTLQKDKYTSVSYCT